MATRLARSQSNWSDWRWRRIPSLVPKAPKLEDRLAALSDLRREPDAPEARKEFTKCLASKISLLAAKGGRIVGECKGDALAPQLVEAFDRFMIDPATSDRRCEAKLAIAR